ncbi:hypothetical protein GGF46_001057 [Coemansia sp. RSA 552]|nr:hypothetical protein GGF46_001057 [Coemansia sp. RSA 552]
MVSPTSRIALVTGGNSGVGLALAHRLLAHDDGPITVVLACRNRAKARTALAQLQAAHPGATVHLLELDTSSVASVLRAAAQVQTDYARLDLLFCNAGAMAISGLSAGGIARGLLTHPVAFFESSEALCQRQGLVTPDGLGLTFQTNVFGHYLLIHKLLPLLEATGGARVVWTGSSASQQGFAHADYQHVHGATPYESSKYIVDQIALPLHKRLWANGVACYVVEPGNVCSSFLAGLGLPLFGYLVLFVFLLLRCVGLTRFTISPRCASFALCAVALADGARLDPRLKYFANATRAGTPFVTARPLPSRPATAAFLVEKLDALVSRFDQPQK